MKSKIDVGIVGASGYTGGELVRLLLNHSNVNLKWVTSRHEERLEVMHPNLLGCTLKFTKLEEVDPSVDAVFFCLPSSEAMKKAPMFLDAGAKVIDLGADFRFKNPERYKEIYNKEHQSPQLLKEVVYGITEINREDIKNARLIANPGCYVITSILGILPLIHNKIIPLDNININALNGTSGAGIELRREVMHPESSDNILPYSLEGHRHSGEIENQLEIFGKEKAKVNFTTAHANFTRGIYSVISSPVKDELKEKLTRDGLLKLYNDFYGKDEDGEWFVRVKDFKKTMGKNKKEYSVYPFVAHVKGSNFCHIGLDYDEERGIVRVISVTDNLVKGAAGSAIQNMNVMFGFDEKAGLEQFGLRP